MLMKTHVEKMSMLLYPTMLVKTKVLDIVCHDVYEK